jgi:hypothetical protein
MKLFNVPPTALPEAGANSPLRASAVTTPGPLLRKMPPLDADPAISAANAAWFASFSTGL